jgi:hypothetical protein
MDNQDPRLFIPIIDLQYVFFSTNKHDNLIEKY